MENNRKTQIQHHKDKEPKETVKYIKQILKKLNIQTEEIEKRKSPAGTYSLRLVIKDTNIGTNGKGMSADLAKASAYAEFMERLQNNILFRIYTWYTPKGKYVHSHDEKFLDVTEIISKNDTLTKYFIKLNKMSSKSKIAKCKFIRSFLHSRTFSTKDNKTTMCLPFENITQKKKEYVPYLIYNGLYGSDGMCAGNTKNEALVEGLSEVIERNIQARVINEKICLPNVPDNYIAKFPNIKRMYDTLKKEKNLKVYLKDASLGGKWPVIALLVINENNGTYGVKFGCHPDINIAMERVFTEAFQGRDLESFSCASSLSFDENLNCSNVSRVNNFTVGTGYYPLRMFESTPDYKFSKIKHVFKNNTASLKYLVRLIESEGYSILIRDVNYFDFPSYHIIVPGFSAIAEIMSSKSRQKPSNNPYMLMMNVGKITKRNANIIIKSINEKSKFFANNNLECFLPPCNNLNLPCGTSSVGAQYLKTMLHIMKEDFNAALEEFEPVMNNVFNSTTLDKRNRGRALIIKKYIEGRAQGLSHKQVFKYLSEFFDEKLCAYTNYIFENPSEIITRQYPIIKNEVESTDAFYPYRKAQQILEAYLEKQAPNNY